MWASLRRRSRDPGPGLPAPVRSLGGVLPEQVAGLDGQIGALDTSDTLDKELHELHAGARRDGQAARLMTMPGVGPVTAMAIQAFAPPMEGFRRGRGLCARPGLVPRRHATGGKPRPGRISRMGQRGLGRLLIAGAMAVVRRAARRGRTGDPWLARMLARKPRMPVAVALANRMARIVRAPMTKREIERVPALEAA